MESGGASFPASRTSTPASNDATTAQKRTKICVYCGASPGFNPVYVEAARSLARAMAKNNIQLVYGGGTVGLMGEVARTLVSLSGPDSVHGIIPEALVRYERDANYSSTVPDPSNPSAQPHPAPPTASTTTTQTTISLSVPEETIFGRTTIVPDMHTRKRLMAQEVLSGGPGSGFIALAGGYGTLEELFETMTWNQLGIHNKGIVILNINGFYDGIRQWINKSVEEGFIHGGNKNILVEAKTAEEAIKALEEYKVSDAALKLNWSSQ
ncbi:hypothetical protein B0T21DRAFT_139109 [Apiosordaria backusii]|uniref:Cytokinin riboside 5'-monophosphate phosphoribohydrolase n=1 Tax=Apiosordaria backusii TaxID=314023 RepID=A0AA40EF58_9PEZI|nr:hypothetical protein B0T21DRAFT_139109 [Apiosordaria backusii]